MVIVFDIQNTVQGETKPNHHSGGHLGEIQNGRQIV